MDKNPDSIEDVYDAIRATDHESTWMETYAELAEHYSYNLPENALEFDNIADMKRRVTASGSHFFDRDAVRHFRGRTDRQLYGRRFWVESAQFVDSNGVPDFREYRVAYVTACGEHLSIERVGKFLTLEHARGAARNLARVVTLNTDNERE